MRARLTLLGPKVGFGALVLACAAIPAAFTRTTAEAFMVPKLTVLRVCLVVAIAGLAIAATSARRWPIPAVAIRWPALLLATWTALATAASVAPSVSLWGQYARYDGLIGLLTGLLVAALVIGFASRSLARLEALAWATMAGGALALAYVLIQGVGWDWIDWYTEAGAPIAQPYGALGNSNFSGAHLAMIVPLALSAATRLHGPWPRRSMVAFAALCGLGVVVTETRGGLLALVAGVAAYVWLGDRAHPAVRWVLGAAAIGGVAVMIGAAVFSAPAEQTRGQGGILETTTIAERREIWRTTVDVIVDHPLVGTGPDTLGLVYPYARTGLPSVNPDEAHNIFLDRAASAGVPALVAYLWLLAIVGRQAWRARRDLEPEGRWLLTGFGGALAAYLVQGTVSIDVVPLVVVAWTSIGVLTALVDPACRRARAGSDRTARVHALPLGAFAAIGVGVLVGISVALRPAIADAHFRRGVQAASQGEPGATSAEHFNDAVDWNPGEARYHVRVGDQLVAIATREVTDRDRRARLLGEALNAYDLALQLRPRDAAVRRAHARATVLLAVADPTDGRASASDIDATYRSLVEDLPDDPRLRLEQGLALEQLASLAADEREGSSLRSRATTVLTEAREDLPVAIGPLLGLARIAVAEGDSTQALAYLDEAQRLQPTNEAVRDARRTLAEDLEAEADPGS